MVVCAMKNCKNYIKNKNRAKSCDKNGAKNGEHRHLQYYRFPRNLLLLEQWKDKCGEKPDDFNYENARVCSIHFTNEDYRIQDRYVCIYCRVPISPFNPVIFICDFIPIKKYNFS